MPPPPHRVPLRTFQRPGFHLSSENTALDALRSARPPPERGARQRNGGSTVKYSNAIEKEVTVACPAQPRDAPRRRFRSAFTITDRGVHDGTKAAFTMSEIRS